MIPAQPLFPIRQPTIPMHRQNPWVRSTRNHPFHCEGEPFHCCCFAPQGSPIHRMWKSFSIRQRQKNAQKPKIVRYQEDTAIRINTDLPAGWRGGTFTVRCIFKDEKGTPYFGQWSLPLQVALKKGGDPRQCGWIGGTGGACGRNLRRTFP